MSNLGAELHIIVWQHQLKEIVIIEVAVVVLVIDLKYVVHVRLLHVVDLVVAQEATDHVCVDDIQFTFLLPLVLNTFEGSPGLELLAEAYLLPLVFNE